MQGAPRSPEDLERAMSSTFVASMAPRLVGVVIVWAGTVLAVALAG